MRFDYLHDSVPDTVDKLRSLRLRKELHAPAGALVAAFLVLLGGWGIETHRLADARYGVLAATKRDDESREKLAKTKLVRVQIDHMLAVDRRLREIHLSGATLSERLADIANRVPQRAWLTSISRSQGEIQIDGRADGFTVLSEAIARLMSSKTVESPTLVRAGRDDRLRGSVLSFEMRVEDTAK